MALEGYQNHSVFAFAVLEGLEKAQADTSGIISVMALANYVSDRVPEITRQRWNYEQFPMVSLQGQNFAIARRQVAAPR